MCRLIQLFCAATAVVLFASGALADVLLYEMDVAPDDVSLPVPMVISEDGFGNGPPPTNDFADPEWCGLQNGTHGPAGTARFSDTGDNGFDGYILDSEGGFSTVTVYTIDMRLKGEENCEQEPGYTATDGRSMQIREQQIYPDDTVPHGCGIQIEPGLTGGNSLHLDFDKFGANGGVYASLDFPSFGVEDGFHMVRLSLRNDGYVYVYDLENDLDPGPGVEWALMGIGESGTDPIPLNQRGNWGGVDGPGIGLNSLHGPKIINSKFLADWVRIDRSHALGATAPILGETPDCLSIVEPEATQTSLAVQSLPASPSQFQYTVSNIGLTDINYTVVKDPDDETTAWLTLDKPGGGPISYGNSDTVTATIDTTDLTEGVYSVDLVFTDDCDPANVNRRTIELTVLGPCGSEVAPPEDPHQTSWAIQGQPATPSQFQYTVSNIRADDITYTVVKDPDNETTAWLTLDKAGGGPISAGNSDTVTATIDTTDLTSGVWTVDLVFTDDCDPPAVSTRTIELTVRACYWEVTPEGVGVPVCADDTSYDFTVKNTGYVSFDYTATKVNAAGLPTEYPWMSLSKGGGSIDPSATDTVTVTVDQDQVTESTIGYVAFEREECEPQYSDNKLIRAVDVSQFTPLVWEYHGDMDPTVENSAGNGLNFRLLDEDRTEQIVEVVADPDATLDQLALHINDNSVNARTRFHSESVADANFSKIPGSTIVARMKTIGNFDSPYRGNLLLYQAGQANSCEYFWSGPGEEPALPAGLIVEIGRGVETTVPEAGDANYHILRMTQIGGGQYIQKAITLYFDEDPDPVVQATGNSGFPGADDGFGFGASANSGKQEVQFDWVTGTDAGAFAPGEEEECIGRSLIPDTALTGACCLPPRRCEETTAFECAARHGVWQGARDCTSITCPLVSYPFADADGDGDVDQDDFAAFQLCYTGPGGIGWQEECSDFDRGDDNHDGQPDEDNDIDEYDYTEFENCATGPGIPWSQELRPDCKP